MSESSNDGVVVTPPLRRFLDDRKTRHAPEHALQPAHSNGDETAPGEPTDRSECCNSSATRVYKPSLSAQQTGKPKRSPRYGTRKVNRSHATPHKSHSIPVGQCACGAKADVVFGDMCEDCYADQAQRWSGKDQSATLYW